MKDLARRTIWITGASSGIGEALAYELAGKGATLILSARSLGELNRVREACSHSERHHVVPLDLERYQDLESIAEDVWARLGPVDILVNNAGVSQRYLALDSTTALDTKIMTINFIGTTALTRPVLKAMVRRDVGHIVTVSSVLGLYGVQTRAVYAASKHALRGYFNSLRNELVDTALTITNIYPGYVTTKVSENALTASGDAYGRIDPGHQAGLSPEACAKRIVRAIECDQAEVVIARGKERLGVWLARFLPALFRAISSRTSI